MVALFSAGCANLPATRDLPEQTAALGLPQQVELQNVPFFPDERYHCGPAVTASLLSHRGQPASIETLVGEVFVPAREGSFQAEIRAALRARDLIALRLPPELPALLQTVADGHPVAVFQNLGLTSVPFWHFAVVVGYDLERNVIIAHSGPHERLETPLDTFARTWLRAGGWATVAMPPDRVPRGTQQTAWITAANELEQNQRLDAAATGYRQALRNWSPRHQTGWIARMGLANVEFARGRAGVATGILQKLIDDEPTRHPAWNNLAHLQRAQGCILEARSAAACAIRITGDPYAYASTRREVLAAPPAESAPRQGVCRAVSACPAPPLAELLAPETAQTETAPPAASAPLPDVPADLASSPSVKDRPDRARAILRPCPRHHPAARPGCRPAIRPGG